MSYLLRNSLYYNINSSLLNSVYFIHSNYLASHEVQRKIAQCYQELELPLNSSQDKVRQAFLDLAKIYHPDSGSPDACINKFCAIEDAFRTLSKHNTGKTYREDEEKIVSDIKHKVPQHRQYLSFEGIGHGTPFQRQKQYAQSRAQKASENVMEHRISKAVATEKTLLKKESYSKKHDIRTKYGFDRVVEDLIQESISKGEFKNLTGTGKPLRQQNRNPYVDFTTHKLNEVLINNGFTPEWITMNKDIEQEIKAFKLGIRNERLKFGPYPLTSEENEKWQKLCMENRNIAKSLNMKINTFNLIVPLINKQKFHIDFEYISEDILKNGKYSDNIKENKMCKTSTKDEKQSNADILSIFINGLNDLVMDFIKRDKKEIVNNQLKNDRKTSLS